MNCTDTVTSPDDDSLTCKLDKQQTNQWKDLATLVYTAYIAKIDLLKFSQNHLSSYDISLTDNTLYSDPQAKDDTCTDTVFAAWSDCRYWL